jgi:SAM-dependent methyltransferase
MSLVRPGSAIISVCCVLTVFAAKYNVPTPDPVIARIQDQIASLDTRGGYYSTTYRKDETLYWVNLPGWMHRDAGIHKAGRILDIGCGYGTLLAFAAELYDAEAYCMDVIHYVPRFGEIRGFKFTSGNIQLDSVPAPGSFDVILMTEVLEHFNFDPLPTLKKIRDALAPDGVFFLSTPDADEWGRQTKYYPRLRDLPPADPSKKFVDDHIWIYNRKELFRLLADAGFRTDRFAYSPGVGHRHFNLQLRRTLPSR